MSIENQTQLELLEGEKENKKVIYDNKHKIQRNWF